MMRLPVSPAFEKNNLAITLQTSDYFAPYASVTMLSIIENASSEYNFDFLVMTWDMREKTAEKLISMADGKDNISIRVVDVSKEIRPYQKIAKKREDYDRFSCAGVVRLIMPELLNNYDIVLNFDCDMLICADVAELFQYDLTDYYMGAVQDTIYYSCQDDEFIKDTLDYLSLSSISQYFNAGMLLLNIKKIREDFSTEQIINFSMTNGTFRRVYEQDAFNGLFREKKISLPQEWNWHVDSNLIIERGAKRLPPGDKYLEKYYGAQYHVKNYHFVTNRKPWGDTSISYADEWWAVATCSPFFDCILLRLSDCKSKDAATKSVLKIKDKYLLFVCETEYQLLNALNIKYHFYQDAAADLILCSTVNLAKYIPKIKNSGLFKKVIHSKYNTALDWSIIEEMPLRIKTIHPEQYEKAVCLDEKYTDYFTPVAGGVYHKMIYYQVVNNGCVPVIHIFEEGASNYTENINQKIYSEGYLDHSLYPAHQRFANNVANIFLYRPDLYNGVAAAPRMLIPKISSDDKEFCCIVRDIFGECNLPDEKYLFFNECFAADHAVSDDIKILNIIAEIVGAENIAVKVHPRSVCEKRLYQLHGYHVFSEQGVMWETAALSPELNSKVLLSISSNAIWTPFVIAKKNIRAISLLNVMKLSKRNHAKTREYQMFLRKIQELANEDETVFFEPNTLSELKHIIHFIEGETQ